MEGERLHVEPALPELVLELRHEQPPVAQEAPQGCRHGVEHEPAGVGRKDEKCDYRRIKWNKCGDIKFSYGDLIRDTLIASYSSILTGTDRRTLSR